MLIRRRQWIRRGLGFSGSAGKSHLPSFLCLVRLPVRDVFCLVLFHTRLRIDNRPEVIRGIDCRPLFRGDVRRLSKIANRISLGVDDHEVSPNHIGARPLGVVVLLVGQLRYIDFFVRILIFLNVSGSIIIPIA